MRIWHAQLIPRLCQKHLCAMWREGIIMLYGILENKPGWRNHPARKEFEDAPIALVVRLLQVSDEMKKRGYHPDTTKIKIPSTRSKQTVKVWQNLTQQLRILKEKRKTITSCTCNV